MSVTTNCDKRNRLMMKCVRHKDTTRNTRKPTAETRKRSTKVFFLECKYRVSVRTTRKDTELTMSISSDIHNHSMAPDSFAFKSHNDKDPGRENALVFGESLRASGIPYIQATRALANQDLKLTRSDYYNLQRSSEKLTSEEELLAALGHLEDMGFHVLTKKVYMIENNERRRRVTEMFFFCSPEQIVMGRRFVSGFVVETDATFNTNELNLPLSALVGVTNTLRTFPMTYCFVPSESAIAFKFMNKCMRTLFFTGDCPGPRVIMGDFAAGLTSTFLEQRNVTLSEAGMNVCFELLDEASLDESGSEVTLQLCSWHAVEAIKKRVVNVGYPKEQRKSLAAAVWHWVHCSTEELLIERRNEVLDLLRDKKKEYLFDFYQPKERQFVQCFIKKLPNLGVESTQRAESSHPTIKRITNRHTSIHQSVQRICREVRRITLAHETEINDQRRNLPLLVNRSIFGGLITLITHQAIEMLLREWNIASKWALDSADDDADEVDPEPEQGCQLLCQLPLRYGLPCKCWLYQCIVEEIPIPISLIHPRWLYDGPDYVAGWSMSFDPDLEPSEYMENVIGDNKLDESKSGDKFAQRGANLIEGSALKALDFHKSIPQSHRAEKYARGLEKYTERFIEDNAKRDSIPQTFPDSIKPKENLTFFKGGSRRRAYTGREAAEAAEVDEQRRKRKVELEARRVAKWAEVEERKLAESRFSQRNFPEETSLGDLPSDDAGDSEFDIPSLPRRRRHSSPITDDYFNAPDDDSPAVDLADEIPMTISSDEKLPDINDIIRLSQQSLHLFSESQLKLTASQVASKSSATTIRSFRGVSKEKTRDQLR